MMFLKDTPRHTVRIKRKAIKWNARLIYETCTSYMYVSFMKHVRHISQRLRNITLAFEVIGCCLYWTHSHTHSHQYSQYYTQTCGRARSRYPMHSSSAAGATRRLNAIKNLFYHRWVWCCRCGEENISFQFGEFIAASTSARLCLLGQNREEKLSAMSLSVCIKQTKSLRAT